MKQIVSISNGSSEHDYEFETEFLGIDFKLSRFGTDGDKSMFKDLIQEWGGKADAIGIGSGRFLYTVGPRYLNQNRAREIETYQSMVKIPVTAGDKLRKVVFEWSIRHLQHSMNNMFTNARIVVLSGMINHNLSAVMSEYTDNMVFADPLLEHGIPKLLYSLKELELYAHTHGPLKYLPGKSIRNSKAGDTVNNYILERALKKATMIMVPYYGFNRYLREFSFKALNGKTIISSTIYDDQVQFLKDKGVSMIIDNTPKMLERVVGINVLEAMVLAALGKNTDEILDDDLLEIVSEQHMDPRVIYPSGEKKQVNRFAFVIHPLSQDDFKKERVVGYLSKVPKFINTMERLLAYSPPFIYSKITGIKSPEGVETEGWLISVGGTPKQMMAHKPEFTYKRLLQAAKMAKRLGAQIMGLGAFTKVIGDAGLTVSRQSDIPITTGNSYSASGALWAAADAVRQMGLLEIEKNQRIKGKAMVVGATGSIGAVCCRLLALAFEELYMVGRNTAKLLELKESIMKESPDTKITLSTRSDNFLGEMDVVVTTTSGAGKKILDIMKVKPGCVITDVARPLDIPAKDVAKRPDVLVIESGEIELPGNPEMRNIGLPPKVAYACLAETIVLALEGKYEVFTVGRDIEWEKVKEIYKMGLKHGMKLAAISGINGVFSKDEIQRVKRLALEARAKQAEEKKEKSTIPN